jgi:uncharacterized membrane protein
MEPEQGLGDPDLEAREIDEGKAAAILAYLPFLCFVPLIKMRENRFAVAHGKQGLVLFFLELLAALLLVPAISSLVWKVVLILCLGAAMAGVSSVLQGGWFKIPVIGQLADRLKL